MSEQPQLLIITGLSGSGKTVALRSLEDLGYYCVDNLPAALLPQFAQEIRSSEPAFNRKVAVGIDVRNRHQDLMQFEKLVLDIRSRGFICEIFYLQAEEQVLIRRFSESRRPHPLKTPGSSLEAAFKEERSRLEGLANNASLFIDTTSSNVHQLRRMLWQRLGSVSGGLSILLESFAFKAGVPVDVDFVFDVRCLPNPHWEDELRSLTGKDKTVQDFLADQEMTGEMITEIEQFLALQIPRFSKQQRAYLTIGIGCTGGKHRSVYMAETLAKLLRHHCPEVLVHHRELP